MKKILLKISQFSFYRYMNPSDGERVVMNVVMGFDRYCPVSGSEWSQVASTTSAAGVK